MFKKILLAPGGSGGGGVATRVEAIEDLDDGLRILQQRGMISEELLPKTEEGLAKGGGSSASHKPAKEDEGKAATEAEAKAAADALAERADEAGRTVEEQQAHEATDEYKAEVAAAELQARATEAGRTVEEQQEFEQKETKETKPEFSDEQKAWLTEQGLLDADGNLVKPADDAAAKELKDRLAEEVAKVKELETKIAESGGVRVTVAPMHRFFTIDSAADLEKEEQGLAEFEKWCINNWDGVEPVEASEDGKTKAKAGYSKEQVRSAYQSTKELREKQLPLARERLSAYQQENEQAKTVYPELFDSKRPEYQVAQAFLKQVPGLRALFPNVMTMVGDMMRGERIREAADKARKAKLAAGGKTVKVAPKIGAITPKPAPAGGSKGTPKGISLARVEELGGGRDALVQAVQESL